MSPSQYATDNNGRREEEEGTGSNKRGKEQEERRRRWPTPTAAFHLKIENLPPY